MLRAAIITVAVLSVSSAALHSQQPPQDASLDDVLARAVRYAAEYQQSLSGIVSEEFYAQTWRRGSKVRDTRSLRSDVLLTKPAGGRRFLLFRDVFEVDGRQVRDRDERLVQLFLKPSAVTSSQVLRILNESARYNIGDISRTVNTPTLTLAFLDPQYRDHFVFERATDRVAEAVRGLSDTDDAGRFAADDHLMVVGYQEVGRDSMIGTGAGLNLFSTGRFWIEPATGRLIMSEVRFRNAAIDALVDVKYAEAPAVGVLVPVAMRERYVDLRTESLVEGTATYSRVRRFQVSSSEAVKDSQ